MFLKISISFTHPKLKQRSIQSQFFELKGYYDGNNKNITWLTIHLPTDNIGLFGYLFPDSKVHNLNILGAKVIGNNYVGGVAGYVWGATVENCVVTGNISGAARVGGIVGSGSSYMMSKSYSTGNVHGDGDNVFLFTIEKREIVAIAPIVSRNGYTFAAGIRYLIT